MLGVERRGKAQTNAANGSGNVIFQERQKLVKNQCDNMLQAHDLAFFTDRRKTSFLYAIVSLGPVGGRKLVSFSCFLAIINKRAVLCAPFCDDSVGRFLQH